MAPKMNICLEGRIALTCFLMPVLFIHLFTLFFFNNSRFLLIASGSICSTCHILIQSVFKRGRNAQPNHDYHYKVCLFVASCAVL